MPPTGQPDGPPDGAATGQPTVLERVRALCLALPGCEERVSHGEPSWFAGGRRMFATFADHHHDDRTACWTAAPAGVQEHLVATDPERFFRPPYVGGRGWIGVYLDRPVDWPHLADLLLEAYRLTAPARLRAALDQDV
ncbi:MmcQ/YjbR family DNA-binding protein [Kitasatospora herbaricolor]|uniref:MmcQ/YjbR family DNA-binding protein n=1 Tax=Kitasatospora herbaricolor TaxID=68217 RepID=UPI0036DDC64B